MPRHNKNQHGIKNNTIITESFHFPDASSG